MRGIERAYPRDRTIHGMVSEQVRRRPDAIALTSGEHTLSYRELEARSQGWAGALAGLGVGAEVLVGVHLERTPTMVAALLGILKAGGAYVPLDPAYPPQRLAHMARDARMRVVVSDRDDLGELPAKLLRPAEVVRGRPAPDALTEPVAACDRLAYVLYTSGSTGVPKGVGLTHRNATDLLHWAHEAFGDDLARVLATTSISFDCSIVEMFATLAWGGTVVLAGGPDAITSTAQARGARLAQTVPSVLGELLDVGGVPASVRTAIVGGEALGRGLAERIHRESSIDRLLNLYGPAECTTYATIATVDAHDGSTPPIGHPVANTWVHVVDERGAEVARGGEGELVIGGLGVARGYLGRPALTAERFVPDALSGTPASRLYRSGDVAREGRGGLHFLGRVDEQVKVRGVRVEPGEIEDALARHPAVREAAVALTAAGHGRHRLTAFCVAAEKGSLAPEDLREHLRACLPRQLVPERFVELERLPRQPNGKVDRRALVDGCGAPAPAATGDARAAASPAEALLQALWARALELPGIGVTDDLFDAGGHSLVVLRVHAELRALGHDVPIADLFVEPTIERLARVLERGGLAAATAGEAPQNARRTQGDGAPLSPNQRAILSWAARDAAAFGLSLPLVVRLLGRVNLAALRAAVTLLARRHEILRSSVVPAPGGPVMRDTGAAVPALVLVDPGGLAPADREERARVAVTAAVARPIDPAGGALVRCAVARLGPHDSVLCLAVHHVVADAWSIETISHQLLELYAALAAGRGLPAADHPQHADYAAAQSRLLASDRGRAQLESRRRRLDGLEPLRLPGDGRREGAIAGTVREIFVLPERLSRRVAEHARLAGATPFMLLLAAFGVLLGRWSGQRDVAIGVPTSGRPVPAQSTMIGPCADSLVVRSDLSGDPTFTTVVRRAREAVLAAFADGDVPFAVVARDRDDGPGRHPVYQAMLVLQERPSLLDPGYSAELVDAHRTEHVTLAPFADLPARAALDVELQFFRRDAELEGVLSCRADVVGAAEARAVAATLPRLLRALLDAPGEPLSRVAVEIRDGSLEAQPATVELGGAGAGLGEVAPDQGVGSLRRA